MKNGPRKYLLKIHRWFGLIGGLWIIVLGFSGLMLDHRDDWGWAWRLRVSDSLLPSHTVEALTDRHITLAQVNPNNTDEWVVGGPLGIWESRDATESWQSVDFDGLDISPMVFGIILDETLGWDRLWLATDDGLWSYDTGQDFKAKRAAIPGTYLTALDNGSRPNELVLVENRTDILRLDTNPQNRVRRIDFRRVSVSNLPGKVSWSRFLFDMHLGRSFFNRPFNMAVNDFGALAMAILAITGFGSWLYRRRSKTRQTLSPKRRIRIFNWLYNSHAPIIGLLAIFPILYLSLTGIIFNHRSEWMMPLVKNKVSREALPPVYDFPTLDREISHIIAYPGQPNKYTIGTRLGVLTTFDSGTSWTRETGAPASPGFVWSLKRHGDNLFLGGLGGPSFVRNLDGENWSMIPGLIGMPSDAARSGDEWYIISGPRMFTGDITQSVEAVEFNLPNMDYKPFMLVMFEVHNGGIIGKWFKYILDLMALFLIYMTITGPIFW